MPVLLLIAFIVVPLLEIYVISQVGHLIGLPLTLGTLLLVSILGAVLVKREGVRAWRNLRSATTRGRMPAREILDGALVLVGGVLLLTPGFLTDAVGFFLVLPVTRPIARRLLTSLALGRLTPAGRLIGTAALGGRAARSWRRRRRPSGSERVVDVPYDRN